MSKPPEKIPFKGQTMPTKTLPISKLDMDLQNPRLLNDAGSQDDAMSQLLVTTGDKCMDLLRDLTEAGELSSSDYPIVIQENNRYTVLEGNRRLLCLRLWKKPNLIQQLGPAAEPYVNRVSHYINRSPYKSPSTIKVAVAKTRDEAREWIQRRHGKNAGGAGVVGWGSYQRDRDLYHHDPSKCTKAYAFISFIAHELPDDSSVQQEIFQLIESQYTVLNRIFDDKSFRNELGIEFSNGVMSLNRGFEETLPALRQIISETVAGTKNANSLYSTDLRMAWARELRALMPHEPGQPYAGSPPSQPNPPKESIPPEVSQKPEQKRPGANQSSSPAKEQTYIFKELDTSGFTRRIQRLFMQTASISVSRKPDVVGALLRVVLDVTCYQFLEVAKPKDSIPTDLTKRVERCLLILDPNAKQALGRVESTPVFNRIYHETVNGPGLKLANYAVHSGKSGMPPSEVIILAERYEPLLVAMNDYLRNTKDS